MHMCHYWQEALVGVESGFEYSKSLKPAMEAVE